MAGSDNPVKRVQRYLSQSAEEWGISLRAARWIFWIPIVGAVLTALARVDRKLYRFLLEDDGPVEWAQFACFVLAFLAGARIAVLRWRSGQKLQGLLYVGFTLAMFFIAGEEIAWGQRILGLPTPEALLDVNKQGEITLHNIGEVLRPINFAMLMIGAFGSVAYVLNQKLRIGRWWSQADYLFVPPFFLAPAFFVVFVFRLVRFTVWRSSGFSVTKYGEWVEFCLAMALFLFASLNARRLAADQPAVAAQPTTNTSTRTNTSIEVEGNPV